MTALRKQFIRADDSPSIDAFGRWRVSNPETIFDSKQLFDSNPLFWDDAETSGSGTGTAHSVNKAATTISVSATTAGTRVRQTFMRFNYQPGKSQLIFCTFSEFDTSTGNTKQVGAFDDNNGLFIQSSAGTVSVVRRSSATGSPVDTAVAQSSWNLDAMDGSGPSGITLDFSKTQILVIDFEWLGVGRVRYGFVVNGLIYYCHELNNANVLATVYMSTPNLPLRYAISNDGTGAADSFDQICSSVISEGGSQNLGSLRYASNANTSINANTAGTIYALGALRLKTTHLGASINYISASIITSTADHIEWLLILNPTVATAITFSDVTNSAVQYGPGNAGNPSTSTLTGGTQVSGGYISSNGDSISAELSNAIRLGASISGTRDEIYLAVRPLGINADISGSITWRELL